MNSFSAVKFGAIKIFPIVVVLFAVSAAYPQGQSAIIPGEERYRIGYQDRVTVKVDRHPDLTQTVDVNPNGTITLFRLPEPVIAVCKTERELATDIAAAYRKDYLRNPEVNVVVAEQRSQSFAVIGAVVKPAQYIVNRRIRLLELLSVAGGPSKEAGSRIILARTGSTSSCKENTTTNDTADVLYADFKIKDVLQGTDNPELRPGDIVSVLEEDSVYVYGNVVRQGQVKFKEPITLMQAIASAEGLKPAAKNSIRVLRQKSGSAEREELVFDIGKIAKKEANDPFLEANDVIAVSEDAAKSIFQSIGRSLTGGLPSIFYRVPL